MWGVVLVERREGGAEREDGASRARSGVRFAPGPGGASTTSSVPVATAQQGAQQGAGGAAQRKTRRSVLGAATRGWLGSRAGGGRLKSPPQPRCSRRPSSRRSEAGAGHHGLALGGGRLFPDAVPQLACHLGAHTGHELLPLLLSQVPEHSQGRHGGLAARLNQGGVVLR